MQNFSWGEISAHAELNEHAGIVSCNNGSGILIETDYLKKYIDSPEILSVGEKVYLGDKECLAFSSGPALHLAVCAIPELEEAFYQLYRDNADRKGIKSYATTTLMHEAFMESIRDSFPALYSTVQDAYVKNLIQKSDRKDNLSEEATKRLDDFEKAYPKAEDYSEKDSASFDFKEAYQALRLKYNELRENYIQLATKYEFLIEQVKRLQVEVQNNKDETLKAQRQTSRLEKEMLENKETTRNIYNELARIKEYMNSQDDNFERMFSPINNEKISNKESIKPSNPLQDEYDKRLNQIMNTDLSVMKKGAEKFPHQFMCWMKESLIDNPNRKDYVIQASIKARKEGYSSQHIKTAIDRFAPEAVNQPKGVYASWVYNTAIQSATNQAGR